MGEKKFAKSPLLYIHQPTIRTPSAPMQHKYTTPKQSKGKSVQEAKKVLKRPIRRDDFNKEMDNGKETVDGINDEEIEEETDKRSDQERKKFKNMTLRERVEYFVNSPKHLPTMKCEVKTDERNHRGVIIDFKDENVIMRVGRRTSATELPFDTINEIRLIGF